MIIKKFTAQTMTEALAKVRGELGTDAIILSTRTQKRGGVLDLVGKSLVEVTAAVDETPARDSGRKSTPPARPVTPPEAGLYPPERPVSYTPPARPAAPMPGTRAPEPSRRGTPPEGMAAVRNPAGTPDIDHIFEDIRELKRSVKVLADSASTGTMDGLPANLRTLLAAMQRSGMDDRISKRLIRQLLNELTGTELADPRVISRKTAELLLTGIGGVAPITLTGRKPKVVAFAGATGSGKTTTIAKIAADFTLNQGKRVAVLTTDTKRVDAVGQLKAYCRIINIPLAIAYTPDDLAGIAPKLARSDLILVDTPGSGPTDRPQMQEMEEFVTRLAPQEVHLVMSVTTSLIEMKRIAENFEALRPNRIAFTKLDETDLFGTMLSFAVFSKKPLSYTTFGQNVPGDFSAANPKDLIRRMLEGKPDAR